MKKIALFITAIITLSLSTSAFGKTKNSESITHYISNTNDGVFTFIENGITFSVFQNGEFDFYINPIGMRSSLNFNRVRISFNSGHNYDTHVQYDDYGAIVQIEGTPIYYDYYGRISRVGFIDIRYRLSRLLSIGGLHVFYRLGHYTHFTGYINPFNMHYNVYHPYHNSFVRPYYNECIVSYRPYRRHYTPRRYDYYNYRHNYNTYSKPNRQYRSIRSRIANTTNSNRSYSRRSSTSRTATRSALRSSVAVNNRRSNTNRTSTNGTRRTNRTRRTNTNSRLHINNDSSIRRQNTRTIQPRVTRRSTSSTRMQQTGKTPTRSIAQRSSLRRNTTSARRSSTISRGRKAPRRK